MISLIICMQFSGSEDCLFSKKATISLTGTVASPNVTGFGSKFLGVAAGGMSNMHVCVYYKKFECCSVVLT